jgi:DUF4097 and DUF4098 domain-containing protein YvlB
MGTNPPPYPPPGPPYGNDWKYQRRMMKEQARAQRDMLRAQANAYRYQMRRMRHGSIVGPIIVIALGITFLLVQTGRLSTSQVWNWYGHWWPMLLIGAGVVMFLEWAFDRYLHTDPAHPVYRRTMGGGVFSLLVLLVLVGILFSGLRHGNGTFFGHRFHINQNDLDQFLGDKHESDQTIVQAFPAGANLSVDNPRGDVIVSGTSDDNQIHIAVHKEIYSRSDADADKKAEQFSPNLSTNNNIVTLAMSALAGGRADLTITVPPSAGIGVSANHGDVRVNSIKAAVSVTANHGDVELSAITGTASAHINNGDASFSAHSITGPVTVEGRGMDLTLSDLSGPVKINGEFYGDCHMEHIRGPVKFHTSRTDLQLVRLDGELEISPNADLSANDVVGPLLLSTGNRNISLDRIAGAVSVTNRNGSVNVTSAPPLGNITIQNRSGSVNITVPDHSNFAVDASTTNGDLDNDFSIPIQGTDTHKTLTGTVGKGGAVLRINTSQGDISLKKASVLPLPPAPPQPPKLSIIDGEGSRVLLGKDGARIISSPDGSSVVVSKNGLEITTNADGSSVYVNKGTKLTTRLDGGLVYIGKDGTRYTSNPDGSKNYVGKDGTHISIRADGAREATGPSGKPLSDTQIADRLRQAEADAHKAAQQRDALSSRFNK